MAIKEMVPNFREFKNWWGKKNWWRGKDNKHRNRE